MNRWRLTFRSRLSCVLLLAILFGSLPALAQRAEGDRLFADGAYAEAAEAYLAASQADPEDASALYNAARAKTYEALETPGDAAVPLYEEAVGYAQRSIELSPDDPDAHLALARAWGRLAQYRGVLESLNLAALIKRELDLTLELEPENDGALHALALWHAGVPWVFGGRPEHVRPLFDQAIAINPTVLHYLEYGETLLDMGDPEAARTQLTRALALSAATAADRAEQERARQLLATRF